MALSDFCKGPVITASPEESVLHASILMRDNKIGSVVITKDERPIGILTDRDIVMRLMTDSKEGFNTKIQEVMTKNPYVVPEGIGIWDLIKRMKKYAVRRFPVVSGEGKIVGMITMDDLIELMGEELSGLGHTISQEVGHGEMKAA
ncbi:MAG TPA: CBS domain-containing protein [Nitrospiria bacterium]|jgi:CBS domain-containing protein